MFRCKVEMLRAGIHMYMYIIAQKCLLAVFPYVGVPSSYGLNVASGDETVSWYGEALNPYGEVILMVICLISLYGETILPCADVILPFFGMISPYADIISPCADTFSAYGDNVSPCAEMTFPYADAIQMDGRCVQSSAEAMSAHDDVILPSADAALPCADIALPSGFCSVFLIPLRTHPIINKLKLHDVVLLVMVISAGRWLEEVIKTLIFKQYLTNLDTGPTLFQLVIKFRNSIFHFTV